MGGANWWVWQNDSEYGSVKEGGGGGGVDWLRIILPSELV